MAYDILSDPEKRRLYDTAGDQGIKGGREERRVYSDSEDDNKFSSEEDEIFFQHGHFRTVFTFSGSVGGSFARTRGTFRNFSFFTTFGQTHNFQAHSESESEEFESDVEDPHLHPSDSESESEPESGVYCNPRNSDPEPDIINISSDSENDCELKTRMDSSDEGSESEFDSDAEQNNDLKQKHFSYRSKGVDEPSLRGRFRRRASKSEEESNSEPEGDQSQNNRKRNWRQSDDSEPDDHLDHFKRFKTGYISDEESEPELHERSNNFAYYFKDENKLEDNIGQRSKYRREHQNQHSQIYRRFKPNPDNHTRFTRKPESDEESDLDGGDDWNYRRSRWEPRYEADSEEEIYIDD